MRRHVLAAAVCLLAVNSARAQGIDGYASVMLATVPHEKAVELRTRVFAERLFEIGPRVRVTTAGFAEGLLADRARAGDATAAVVRPQELHVELTWPHADMRIGWSRVVWGRLDEFLPTDVVNPQDLSRFFLEGRSEGRMPVGMVRARLLPSETFSLEGIYVPFFRRGRFDQLDETSSPFNLVPRAPIVRNEPGRSWRSGQGGVRASLTTGRVDWAVSAYRGFVSLPEYDVEGVTVSERFPRFTMVGADFETARGEWGVRGELAARDDLVEGGVGLDRRAGAYRISGNVVVSDTANHTDALFVVSLDRTFARETRRLRAFTVYNPSDDSAFARVILAFNLQDNVTLETSAGVFAGDGTGSLGRLATRDFAYARFKVFF